MRLRHSVRATATTAVITVLTVLTLALSRLRHEDNLIWTYIDAADMTAAGASAEDAEGVVDVIRVARRRLEYQVTGRGKKHLESSWKALLQSRSGDLDALLRAACVALLMGERVKVVAQFLADASKLRKSVGPASLSGGPGLRDPGLFAWMKQAGNPIRAKSEAAILKKMASFLKKARK